MTVIFGRPTFGFLLPDEGLGARMPQYNNTLAVLHSHPQPAEVKIFGHFLLIGNDPPSINFPGARSLLSGIAIHSACHGPGFTRSKLPDIESLTGAG